MPTKAHRDAVMMRHVADIKSTHSSNNCEHHRHPLDVVMTTQPTAPVDVSLRREVSGEVWNMSTRDVAE